MGQMATLGRAVLPKETVPFYPLVDPAQFQTLWLALCGLGLALLAAFFV